MTANEIIFIVSASICLLSAIAIVWAINKLENSLVELGNLLKDKDTDK